MRKRGTGVSVDEAWLRAAREAMQARYGARPMSELARRIGAHPSTVSKLFSSGRGGADVVELIARDLGLPTPRLVAADPVIDRWSELGEMLRQAAPGKFTSVIELAEQMLKSAREEAAAERLREKLAREGTLQRPRPRP